MHLQGVGQVDTIRASELKINDVVMFNFGLTAQVTSLGKGTTKFVEITFLSHETNTLTTAKYKKDKEMCLTMQYGESL